VVKKARKHLGDAAPGSDRARAAQAIDALVASHKVFNVKLASAIDHNREKKRIGGAERIAESEAIAETMAAARERLDRSAAETGLAPPQRDDVDWVAINRELATGVQPIEPLFLGLGNDIASAAVASTFDRKAEERLRLLLEYAGELGLVAPAVMLGPLAGPAIAIAVAPSGS
jgi:hypothetical protein